MCSVWPVHLASVRQSLRNSTLESCLTQGGATNHVTPPPLSGVQMRLVHYGPQTCGRPAVHPWNGKISWVTASEFELCTCDIWFPQVWCLQFLLFNCGWLQVHLGFAGDTPVAGFFCMYRTCRFSCQSTGPWKRMRIFWQTCDFYLLCIYLVS
jgi:hypothetical protein